MVRKVKQGFTLVEVSLFLAVTGMLFIGIVAGVQGSLFNQRYNDSVQSFAEFLRTVYSQTSNVESTFTVGGGRSGKAIYGKLVVFGESRNIERKPNIDKTIFSYTVVGDADGDISSGNVIEALAKAKINVFVEENGGYEFAGIYEPYFPRWSAGIETTAAPYTDFIGALLIVRHPNSGTVFTYVLEGETIEINQMRGEATALPDPLNKDSLDRFSIKDVDFCVNPDPGRMNTARRDVRIVAGARNASGVEIIAQDDYSEMGNKCQ